MKKLFLFAILLWAIPVEAACTGGSPTWNCTANAADIAAAISGGAAGDTINVAAGTIATLNITINGRNLKGAGTSTDTQPTSSSGTIIQGGTITVTKNATYNSRVSGFSYTGNSNFLTIGGSQSDKPFIIDRNYIHSNGGDAADRMVILTVNGGLFYKNSFTADSCGNCNQDVFNIQTSETWTDGDDTMGTADTTGERNIYFEGNWMTGITETAPDCDARSRVVFRYNTYTDASIVCHSGYETTAGYADTTLGGGVRHFEIYNNDFVRVSNALPVNKWMWVRGATGVIANNTMDKADSPDGSSYTNKPEIPIGLNCNGGAYPMEHQVGQINKVTDTTPDKPLLIFGNTAGQHNNGPADSNFISVGANNSGGFTCSDPSTYIQLNRDYYLSNQWGWTAASCPHPLAGTGTCSSTGAANYTLTGSAPPDFLSKKIVPKRWRKN